MKNFFRHLSSFIAPIVMCFVLPYLIVSYEVSVSGRAFAATSAAQRYAGLFIWVTGFLLFLAAIRLFLLIGNGTIMPWDPTRRLIIAGLYRHVRNPMILSLLILLSGEAILFASQGIALLAVAFFAINTIYFRLLEEPGLERRFGEEYKEYKKNVPMWLPRIKPWRPV